LSSTILSIRSRVLLSRLLTRSGDQAWDFAVPLVLVALYPGQLQIAVLYYLLIRTGQSFLAPRVGRFIDRRPRLTVARWGIGLQTAGLVLGVVGITACAAAAPGSDLGWNGTSVVLFAAVTVAGLVSSLGALIMEIAVASDVIPTIIAPAELAAVNSRLKQIDLATEVGSPILAGLLLTLATPSVPLLGFLLVGLWNVLSFGPEYWLIGSVLKESSALAHKEVVAQGVVPASLGARLVRGWRDFFRQPVMPAMLAFALLWLSVLSPHGVILTTYLKGAWHLPEVTIGIFRGLGAVFGLGATYLFPVLERRLGLIAASRALLTSQAVLLLLALGAFHEGSQAGRLGFLALILFSRIGMYGFSLGETQIRQLGIAEGVRGEVNAFAAALTSVATLGLYGMGALWTNPEDFHTLVALSVTCVTLAAAVFAFWTGRPQAKRLGVR
jgi:iron-regulated transporter 1